MFCLKTMTLSIMGLLLAAGDGSAAESNDRQEFVRWIWEELPSSGTYYLTIECEGYSHGFRSVEFDFASDVIVNLGEVLVRR